jgi:anti-anti-sigma factor
LIEQMTGPAALQVSIERRAAGTVVRLAGELDLAGEPALRGTLTALVAEHQPIALDLTGLVFCDIRGARLLADVRRHEAAVELRHATAAVRRVLDLTADLPLSA